MKVTFLFACCCLAAGFAPAAEFTSSPSCPCAVLAAGDEVEEDPAIIVAAAAGNVAKVQRMLDAGVDIHTRNYCGWTPLHVAAQEGKTAVVRLLLESGAHVDMKDDYGRTPLQYGVLTNLALVKLLVEYGADVNSKDQDGETPLSGAAMEGGCESEDESLGNSRNIIIKYLKSMGAK